MSTVVRIVDEELPPVIATTEIQLDLGLPWVRAFRKRCRARAYPGMPGMGGYFGRCELAPHPHDVPHALERGFDTPRWVVLTVA